LIKLKQAVIVEGKYDKITLENLVDAYIITTDGFGIFKDKEKCELIRTLAQSHGIIVMTDSDSAGALIRAHLKSICGDGEITNVYIPELIGKEKRKSSYSKQRLLGVEGMSKQVLLQSLARSGITGDEVETPAKKVTKTDLFKMGLSGGENSAFLRKQLCEHLKIPKNLSANAFLDAINAVYGYKKFERAVQLWRHEADKK